MDWLIVFDRNKREKTVRIKADESEEAIIKAIEYLKKNMRPSGLFIETIDVFTIDFNSVEG